jgi:hypothetical protein
MPNFSLYFLVVIKAIQPSVPQIWPHIQSSYVWQTDVLRREIIDEYWCSTGVAKSLQNLSIYIDRDLRIQSYFEATSFSIRRIKIGENIWFPFLYLCLILTICV